MKESYACYGIGRISKLFGKSRQAYYQMCYRQSQEKVNFEKVCVFVKKIRKDQPEIGTRKLYVILKSEFMNNGIKIGRDKFFRLLGKHGLLVKSRRKRINTTNSDHLYKKYPNLIKGYIARGPEQIWVSDITYLSTKQGFVYLSLVTDQYSKKIMGYHVHLTLDVNGPLEALKMALKGRTHLNRNIIHHSDRGIQYCCYKYITMLKKNGILISMSARGNPYENAVAERVNGILKSEFYLDKNFNSIQESIFVVRNAVKIYNTLRPHASCDYLTPEQAHKHSGMLNKRWKKYKRKKQTNKLEPIGEEVKKVLSQLSIKTETLDD